MNSTIKLSLFHPQAINQALECGCAIEGDQIIATHEQAKCFLSYQNPRYRPRYELELLTCKPQDPYAAIPEAMRSKRQWVLWNFEQREGQKKPTKVPYSIGGYKASSTKSSTWASFNEVLELRPRFDGIGFVFAGDISGVDFDHVLNDEQKLITRRFDALLEVLERDAILLEVSPSGRGLHAYLDKPLSLPRNKKSFEDGTAIEAYTVGRFFTVTGERWVRSWAA